MRVKFKHKVEKAKGACLHPKNVTAILVLNCNLWCKEKFRQWKKTNEPSLLRHGLLLDWAMALWKCGIMSRLRKGFPGEPTLAQVGIREKIGDWCLWLFAVRALCYHPSQPLLATGGDDGRVKVWPANVMEITRVKFRYDKKKYPLIFKNDQLAAWLGTLTMWGACFSQPCIPGCSLLVMTATFVSGTGRAGLNISEN